MRIDGCLRKPHPKHPDSPVNTSDRSLVVSRRGVPMGMTVTMCFDEAAYVDLAIGAAKQPAQGISDRLSGLVQEAARHFMSGVLSEMATTRSSRRPMRARLARGRRSSVRDRSVPPRRGSRRRSALIALRSVRRIVRPHPLRPSPRGSPGSSPRKSASNETRGSRAVATSRSARVSPR